MMEISQGAIDVTAKSVISGAKLPAQARQFVDGLLHIAAAQRRFAIANRRIAALPIAAGLAFALLLRALELFAQLTNVRERLCCPIVLRPRRAGPARVVGVLDIAKLPAELRRTRPIQVVNELPERAGQPLPAMVG